MWSRYLVDSRKELDHVVFHHVVPIMWFPTIWSRYQVDSRKELDHVVFHLEVSHHVVQIRSGLQKGTGPCGFLPCGFPPYGPDTKWTPDRNWTMWFSTMWFPTIWQYPLFNWTYLILLSFWYSLSCDNATFIIQFKLDFKMHHSLRPCPVCNWTLAKSTYKLDCFQAG